MNQDRPIVLDFTDADPRVAAKLGDMKLLLFNDADEQIGELPVPRGRDGLPRMPDEIPITAAHGRLSTGMGIEPTIIPFDRTRLRIQYEELVDRTEFEVIPGAALTLSKRAPLSPYGRLGDATLLVYDACGAQIAALHMGNSAAGTIALPSKLPARSHTGRITINGYGMQDTVLTFKRDAHV